VLAEVPVLVPVFSGALFLLHPASDSEMAANAIATIIASFFIENPPVGNHSAPRDH
jgi:hypothetical protein